MMMIIGFILGFAFAVAFGYFGSKALTKKGEYASAIWNEKDQTWIVRGRFLATAGKISHAIREENGKGVKYKH